MTSTVFYHGQADFVEGESCMPRLISADVIDDQTSDWSISDEGKGSGAQRGPITTWPAPILRHDDRNPLLPFTSMGINRRRGQLDAYDFLREKVTSTNLFGENRGDEASDCPPSRGHTTDGFDSYAQNIEASGCCDAGMLYTYRDFLARTDAGALDSYCDAGNIYDDIGNTYHAIENKMVKWGAKLTPQQKKKLLDAAHHAQQFAMGSGRWPSFATFKKHMLEVRREALGPNAAQDAEFEREHFTWLGDRYPGGGILSVVGGAVSSVGSGIASVGKGAFAIATAVATPVAGLITSPIRLASDIAQGKNVLESVKNTVTRDIKNIKGVAPYAQAVISFVPGIGQGVNAAIAAGAALANGQSITSALVAGVKNALPGGPIAQQAFDTAYQVARGANVGEAALAAARNQIPGGPAGKAAFDAGIAVAKGQNIQQAAVGVVKGAAVNLLPTDNAIVKSAVSDIASGGNVLTTALKAGTSAMATFSPKAVGPFSSLGPRMKDTISTENLAKLLPEDVQKVASAVLKNPALRGMNANQLALKLGVTNHVAREGMASVLQSVIRSGGAAVPHLAPAKALADQIPMTATFDQGMAKFASKMSPISFSHNARRPMGPGTRYAAMNIAKMKNPHIVPVYAQQNRETSLARANAINPWRRPSFSANGFFDYYDAGALDPTQLPVLKQGSSGEFVVQWQKILGTATDGKFGPQTHSLTRQFQAKKGLTADGIVGPNTWRAGLASLVPVTTAPPISIPGLPPITPIPISQPIANAMPMIRQGSTGTAVKTWQAIVGVPVDGQFGPQTATATRTWQAKNGLVADGIVGPATWTKALQGGATTIPSPPPVATPPISIPTPIGPVSIPTSFPTVPTSFPTTPTTTLPPLPPIVTTTTPIPGGPIITTTTPTGGGPVVVSQPPITEPPTKGAGAGVAIAVGLGLLYFVAKGSSGKLL